MYKNNDYAIATRNELKEINGNAMFTKLVFITEGQHFFYIGFEFYIGGTLDCF